ncbi:MAG: hypothetical protein K2P58_04595 [Hyphomonadaceae bacterium]|nr:hypothetical protein [Hyphomonadaceae bacterium]
MSAFAFNLCLLLLPIAGASALIVIARDQLYSYEFSQSGAREVASQVARLNGELIQIDFDRQNQWDGLIAMELQANDWHAARGFLLSGGGMLPRRSANVLNRTADATDAELEIAALQFLNINTRQRYQELAEQRRAHSPADPPLGDAADFRLLAQGVLDAPENSVLQFILTGYALGLAGELSPRMAHGAGALLDASRREDYPEQLSAEVEALLMSSVPYARYVQSASDNTSERSGVDYEAAFRAAVVPAEAAKVRTLLDDVGAMGEATSRRSAAIMLTHATTLRDLPRLRLIAQSAGDRAAAAAKRLPRDGRLLTAARGALRMSQDLAIALGIAVLALAGLVAVVVAKIVQGALDAWRAFTNPHDEDDLHDHMAELIELGGGRTWRPL